MASGLLPAPLLLPKSREDDVLLPPVLLTGWCPDMLAPLLVLQADM
jgi:hypothetical protein